MIAHQARKNLIDFAIATDRTYQDTWFHEVLATVLQESIKKVENGEDVRVIIEAPPRHGKSEISTKKFPAWVLGEHPDWPIVVGSYSGDLAVKFGQDTRDIMQSYSYQQIFRTRLSIDSKAKGYWRTDEGGSYFAAGRGGAFTGTGFKIGIIDDIFKNREEADSQTIRDSAWDWYRSTFYTRQEGASAIIIINTRWHTDDLVGRLLEQQKKDEEEGNKHFDRWKVISFPAIAIKDEDFRKQGDALWPEKFSIDKLRKTESTLGPYEFLSLYQATPISSENQEFKQHWFKYRPFSDVEVMRVRKIATIDPGGKEAENDSTGVIRNYVTQENFWYIKGARYYLDSAEIINLIFILHEEGFEIIGIEETVFTKAIKPFFEEECRKRNKFPNVVPLKHGGRSKEVRIRGLIPRYSSGTIIHIEGECGDLEKELLVFPKGAHDDVPDALAYQNDIAEPPMGERQVMMLRSQRQERMQSIKKNYALD